jgi:hypothetical protein
MIIPVEKSLLVERTTLERYLHRVREVDAYRECYLMSELEKVKLEGSEWWMWCDRRIGSSGLAQVIGGEVVWSYMNIMGGSLTEEVATTPVPDYEPPPRKRRPQKP